MNIQCENCAAEHELDPPAWVLSSGRPFRFRCSVCGHSQMAAPPTTIGLQEDAATPGPAARQPAERNAGAEGTPVQATAATSDPPATATPVSAPASETSEGATEAQGVFLKQDGKVYLVKDWATLQRWIMERRVGREDLVSDGGVRWEPIGSRPELGSFFAAVEQLEAAELAGLRGGDTPFPTEQAWGEPIAEASQASGLARLDDETEGVPLGLPPLPTEDLDPPDAGGDEYPEQPPSRLSAATPAPETVDSPATPLDPTPSMPMFAEEDEPAVDEASLGDNDDDDDMPFSDADLADPAEADASAEGAEPAPADAPTDEPDEPASPDEQTASDEPAVVDDPLPGSEFEERGVTLEERPALRPGDSVVDFADSKLPADRLADANTESPDELAAEATDEFDPDDPFRDFSDTVSEGGSDDEIVVRSGPPRWLGVGAAVVVTLLAALLFIWLLQNGYFDGGDGPPADTGASGEVTDVIPDPVVPELPPAPADTDAVDTDAVDTDAVDTDAADTDAADTDVAAATVAPDPVVEAPKPDPVTPKSDPVTPKLKADPVTPAPKPDPVVTTPDPKPAAGPSVARLKGLGWAAIDKGQIPDAIDSFKRAVGRSPRDAEAQYGLGYAYLQANDRAQANVHLCQAQSLAKGNVDITRQVSGELTRQSMSCP